MAFFDPDFFDSDFFDTSDLEISLDAEPGSYSVSEVDATLQAQRALVATAGSSTLTGFDATFVLESAPEPGIYILEADSEAYLLSGIPASILASRLLNGASESYLLSGLDAQLEKFIELYAESGSYALTGLPVTFFVSSQTLLADPGAYAHFGYDATLDIALPSSLKARVRFGVNVLEGDLRVYKNGIWERTELRTR